MRQRRFHSDIHFYLHHSHPFTGRSRVHPPVARQSITEESATTIAVREFPCCRRNIRYSNVIDLLVGISPSHHLLGSLFFIAGFRFCFVDMKVYPQLLPQRTHRKSASRLTYRAEKLPRDSRMGRIPVMGRFETSTI